MDKKEILTYILYSYDYLMQNIKTLNENGIIHFDLKISNMLIEKSKKILLSLRPTEPMLARVLEEAKEKGINLPKVVIIPEDTKPKFEYDGETVMVCPAQLKDKITCKDCGLCQVKDRKFVIGFRVHGAQKTRS